MSILLSLLYGGAALINTVEHVGNLAEAIMNGEHKKPKEVPDIRYKYVITKKGNVKKKKRKKWEIEEKMIHDRWEMLRSMGQ
jgi:negative regulator of replication initiation